MAEGCPGNIKGDTVKAFEIDPFLNELKLCLGVDKFYLVLKSKLPRFFPSLTSRPYGIS
ncbi:hypothetical protein DOT_5478 [Desulfosporosinus sp. OT]|nr:hypothetical protein DOT_5478 [Desulfosporosinus sp. OT]